MLSQGTGKKDGGVGQGRGREASVRMLRQSATAMVSNGPILCDHLRSHLKWTLGLSTWGRRKKTHCFFAFMPLLRLAQLHARAAQAGHPKTTEKFGLKGRCTDWGLMVVPFICDTLKLVCPDAEQVTEAVAEIRESGVGRTRCLIQIHPTCPLCGLRLLPWNCPASVTAEANLE